jgi:glycogen synthase
MSDLNVPSKWKKNWDLMDSFFSEDEISVIKKKLENLEIKVVALCAFESRFAQSGGLGTVIKALLPALAEEKKLERVLLMTPFYPKIISASKLTPTGIEPFDVIYAGKPIKVELLKYVSGKKPVEEYYLKAPGFFESQGDPYNYYPDDPEQNHEAQRENALFFCKAVPRAMKSLGIRENIVFHLKEWQTALITLTCKEAMLDGTLVSGGCVLSMHNPFDSRISLESLAKITANKKILESPRLLEKKGLTAYQLGLQLVDAPVTTVSEHFAEELTVDLLQTGHFADHLQEILKKNPLLGINNGMFIGFPPEFSPVKKYTIPRVKKIKLAKRKALLDILATYHPEGRFGSLTYQNDSIGGLPDNVPILVMSGRLDPFQKGYDILLRAVEKFAPDEIKVILTPMSTRNSDLDYFREMAGKCEGNMTVFPIRMEKGFRELQMGSTFGIMPSIYEPFGAAVEYMVNGTVNVSRSTGGLVDQIQHRKSGFLYREDPQSYTLDHIKSFAQTNDAVQSRGSNPWVQSMVAELYKTITEVAALYRNHEDEYYRMVLEGFKQAKTFTWQKAVERYYKVYEKINAGLQ